MSRKRKSEENAAIPTIPDGHVTTNDGVVRKPRAVKYLVIQLADNGVPTLVVHIAKSYKAAARWVESSDQLLRQLGRPVAIFQARPKTAFVQE